MRIRLTVEGPGGAASDVDVDVDPSSSVEEVIDAIAGHLGLDTADEWEAVSDRKATVLDPLLPVALAGLASGDRIVLRSRGEHERAAGIELEVTAGPLCGTRLTVALGRHVLGRKAPEADVVLPELSVSNPHAEIEVNAEGCWITDLGSTNGIYADGERLDGRLLWTDGVALEFGDNAVVLHGQTIETRPAGVTGILDPSGEVPFNRPPRLDAPFTPPALSLEAPPPEPHTRRIPIGAAALPLLLGLVLFAVTKTPTMLVFTTLGPMMAVYNYWDDRHSGRGSYRTGAAAFRARLEEVGEQIDTGRRAERAALLDAAPDPEEIVRRAVLRSPKLWERRPSDPDFLRLRLGTHDAAPECRATIASGGSDQLRAEADARLSGSAILEGVPADLPLRDSGVVSITGARRRDLARWLVLQAAVLHSPRDLHIAVATSDDQMADWAWSTWLPHCRDGGSSLVTGDLGEAGELASDLTHRKLEDGESVLIVWDGAVALGRERSRDLLGNHEGVHVLWLEEVADEVPGVSAFVVRADSEKLTVDKLRAGSILEGVIPDAVAVAAAERAARALAPLRDTSGRGAAGDIPDHIGLLEALGLGDDIGATIAERWRSVRPADSLVLGATRDGPFTLDFSRDGSHVLIGGITEGGKSVLLQSAVAALATNYPPSRVSFVLVDYKGTAAFGPVEGLPHTAALVTDLRPELTARALTSLRAELQRRKTLLDEVGLSDLKELAVREPNRCPPRLVLVIDEFAALKNEVPEFLDGVLEVARQGRTLLVNLILATQEPGEAVTRGVTANVDVRIALRVADPELSRAIIGAPDAGWISKKQPGRAIARMGPGNLVELQVANAKARSDRDTERSVVITKVGSARGPSTGGGPTDLERIVDAIHDISHDVERPPPLWLPPLPELIAIDTLEPAADDGHPVVGLVDEPAAQRQGPHMIALEDVGAIAVLGAARTGKTTVLRTIAASLARAAPPDELHLYALDFATRGLQSVASLPHCSAVVFGEDRDRVERLFAELRRTIDQRKAAFASRGVASLTEYRAATGDRTGFPRIVVLLDGVTGFYAAYERVDLGALIDSLPGLVSDGTPLGVHFVFTSERKLAFRSTLDGLITERVVLRLANASDYSDLRLDDRSAGAPPGRALTGANFEIQVAFAGEQPDTPGQTAGMVKLGADLLERWGARRAPELRLLPASISGADLPAPTRPLRAVVGLDEAALAASEISLVDRHFLAVGPNRSGRTTTMARIARSLRAASDRVELRLLAPRRNALVGLDIWSSAARGDACAEALAALAEEIDARPDDGTASALVIVIDDVDELDQMVKPTIAERVVRRSRDRGVRIVAATETRSAHRAFGGFLAELRKEKHGILLQPELDVDGELLGVRLPRRTGLVLPPGRGFLVVDGRAALVQIGDDLAAPEEGNQSGAANA